MSAECSGYLSADGVFVAAFSCPKAGNVAARFCCGFNDLKYCCDDPNSFYPHDYAYMWWLRFVHTLIPHLSRLMWGQRPPVKEEKSANIWALVGLSFAAVVLLAFLITVCVLCYLFITTKPSRRDNNIPLRAPASDPQEGSSLTGAMCASGPQGFRKHFMSRKLHCDNQLQDPERLFQRCFTSTVTGGRVESPS